MKFPCVILLIDSGYEVLVNCAEDIPDGEAFRVIESKVKDMVKQ